MLLVEARKHKTPKSKNKKNQNMSIEIVEAGLTNESDAFFLMSY